MVYAFMISAVVISAYVFVWKFATNSKSPTGKIPLSWKVFLVGLLTFLIVVPLGVIAVVFAFVMYGIGRPTHVLTFRNPGSAFTTALYILVSFLTFEGIIRSAIYKVYTFKRDPKWLIYQISSLITSTLIFWFVASAIPGVNLRGIKSAFSLSLVFHILEWAIRWIQQKLKNNQG